MNIIGDTQDKVYTQKPRELISTRSDDSDFVVDVMRLVDKRKLDDQQRSKKSAPVMTSIRRIMALPMLTSVRPRSRCLQLCPARYL